MQARRQVDRRANQVEPGEYAMQTGLSFFARLHRSITVVCGCRLPTCAGDRTPSAPACERRGHRRSLNGGRTPFSIRRGRSSSGCQPTGSCARPTKPAFSRRLPSCATGRPPPICVLLSSPPISASHLRWPIALLDGWRQLPRRRPCRQGDCSAAPIRRPRRAPFRQPRRRRPPRRHRYRDPSGPDRRLRLP